MKKVTKIMGLCAVLALSFMSCKKNEEKATLSFKATIEQPTCNDKTYIEYNQAQDYYILKWNSGDRARVFKKDGSSADFETQDEGATTTATFYKIDQGDFPPSEDGYAVFYPADFAIKDGKKVRLTFRKDQVYKEGGIETNTFPMAAAGPDFNFTFSSPCGILKVPLYSEGSSEITVKKIELRDNHEDNPIAGTLNVGLNQFVEGYTYNNINIDILTFPQTFFEKTITLHCPEGGITLSPDPDNAKDFYFVVPTYPDKYTNTFNPWSPYTQVFEEGFTITIYDMAGNKIMDKNTPAGSKLYTMKSQTILRMEALKVYYEDN